MDRVEAGRLLGQRLAGVTRHRGDETSVPTRMQKSGAVAKPALDLAQNSKNALREDGRVDDGNGG